MSQQQQQPGGEDQEFIKLGICLLICVIILWGVLATQEYRLNAVIGAVTWVHILPFALAGKYVPFLADIPFLGNWLFSPAMQAMTFLERGGYAVMEPPQRTAILAAGGRSATVIYGAVLSWIAVRGKDFRVDQKYRTLHTLESMIRVQSEDWVTSRIARHVNPLKGKEIDARRIAEAVSGRANADTAMPGNLLPKRVIMMQPGTWNRALRPEEWLISNGLAFDPDRFKELSDPERNAKVTDFEFKGSWEQLDLEEISEVLSVQLRSPWKGPEQLRPSLRAVYAVMALFYDYDIDGGNKLLNELALLADGTGVRRGGMDFAIQYEAGMLAKVDKIALGRQGKMLAKCAQHHAWVESAFPTLMAVARKDRGVLPPAAFLWLKVEDRLLWYILNNVGNDAVMVEAAGAIAHSRAETQISKPLFRPAVYQAARALLEDYLDMTPERIESRRDKAFRQRSPGDQLNMLRDQIMFGDAPDQAEEHLDVEEDE